MITEMSSIIATETLSKLKNEPKLHIAPVLTSILHLSCYELYIGADAHRIWWRPYALTTSSTLLWLQLLTDRSAAPARSMSPSATLINSAEDFNDLLIMELERLKKTYWTTEFPNLSVVTLIIFNLYDYWSVFNRTKGCGRPSRVRLKSLSEGHMTFQKTRTELS